MEMRRTFSREFKLEAVKLVVERGVAVAQACRDLDVAESVLRRWMRELAQAPASAFRGHGQLRSEQVEIVALKKEVARLRAERDILKRPRPTLRGKRDEVRLRREAPPRLACELALRGLGGVAFRFPCLAGPTGQRPRGC